MSYWPVMQGVAAQYMMRPEGTQRILESWASLVHVQRVHASCYDVHGTGYLTLMQLLGFVQHLLLRLTDVAEVEQLLPLDAYAVLASARISLSLAKAGRCPSWLLWCLIRR